MFLKKLFFLLPAAFLIFTSVSFVKAETLSISAGLPVSYTFNDSDVESDGVTGTLLHVKLPIFIGLGLETYSVGLKDMNDGKVDFTMLDIFYLFPIPIVNITLGVGVGSSSVSCNAPSTGGSDCSDLYESGTPTQVYGQFGLPVFGPIDLHLSYHSVRSAAKGKTINGTKTPDLDTGGNMLALGVAFTF